MKIKGRIIVFDDDGEEIGECEINGEEIRIASEPASEVKEPHVQARTELEDLPPAAEDISLAAMICQPTTLEVASAEAPVVAPESPVKEEILTSIKPEDPHPVSFGLLIPSEPEETVQPTDVVTEVADQPTEPAPEDLAPADAPKDDPTT